MSITVVDERKHERIFRSDRVVFRVVPGTSCPGGLRRESSGRASDLSEDGACIVTDVPVPLRAMLDVRVTIIEPPAIFTHKAVVRWSRKSDADDIWRAGVEFQHNSAPHQKEEWYRLIQSLREASTPAKVSAA
jgi:hypothetical protein